MRNHRENKVHTTSERDNARASALAESVSAVALSLSVSERSVWRLLSGGHLSPVKVGRRTLVDAASLRRFVTEGGAR